MITINVDFRNRRAEELAQLNALLATMKLKNLLLQDTEGYMETTTDGDGNLLGYRYGLDCGKLVCELSEGEGGYCYQIDSVVVDINVDHRVFLDLWRENHPDRILRIVISSEFDDVVGYLIVHHQRT